MRRGRVFLYLSLILILLVVGGYFLYQNFLTPSPSSSPQQAQPTAVPDYVEVVVVTQRAPRGTVLNETLLGTIPLPREVVIPGMFTDLAQVVGRQVKFDLDSGIPLTANMLVDSAEQLSDAGSAASLSIPQGMVAKSIPTDRLSSVAYSLRAGDRVVVIASMPFVDLDSEFQTILPNATGLVFGTGVTGGEGEGAGTRISLEITGGADSAPFGQPVEIDQFEDEIIYVIPSEPQRPRLATQIIIPSATVLQVGDFPFPGQEKQEAEPAPTPTPAPGAQTQPEGQVVQEEEPEPPDIITLIVSPQEAVNLTYLLESGIKLDLALRSAGDNTVVETKTMTIQTFLNDYSIPLPAKLPYGLAPRVDDVDVSAGEAAQPEPTQ